MVCPSCKRERGRDRCLCGSSVVHFVKHGDIGYQVTMQRQFLPAVYKDGALRRRP